MKRIDPINFQGPRAYFTDFDYKIVRFKSHKEVYRREVERRLKIILLTKNTVVCAASHLTHEFAYNLFKDNPILLTESMILPALRRDIEHITDYLEERTPGEYPLAQDLGIKSYLKENMKDFYRDHVNNVVDWELIENTAWFRENLLKALNNDNSVIRRNLTNLPKGKLAFLIDEIKRNDILTRELILKNISTWPPSEQKTLLNFVNLVYHMSGARVVRCESNLPQENYIDYSLADISKHRIILSETQIFWKIFLELAFETMLKRAIPIELLDTLTFEDIFYVRKPIQKSSFREKYDEMIQKGVQAVERNNPDELLYDINELLQIKDRVSKGFEEVFETELHEVLKNKHVERVKRTGKSTLSLGLGLAGFIPGVSEITNAISLLSSSRELIVNLNQDFRGQQEIEDYQIYLKRKEKALHDRIKRSSFSRKSELLSVVNLLTESIATKIIF